MTSDILILKPLVLPEVLGVVVVNKRRCKLGETLIYIYSEIEFSY